MRLAQRFRPYTVNKTKRANLQKRDKRVRANHELLKALAESASK
jgi:hypothetical protein